MRGSCNYKNKNKNHKRSTGGEGSGIQKNQHSTWLSTTRCTQSTGTKTRVGGERGWDKRERGERKSAVEQKNTRDVTMQVHTVQCKHTHTHTRWEITELSSSANRKRTEVEIERSHWNGRTNYKRCICTCGGEKKTFRSTNNSSHWRVTCKTNTHMLMSTENTKQVKAQEH